MSAVRFRRQSLLIGAVFALVAAAVLVAYLQRRLAIEREQQTAIVLQQVCDRTASVLAAEVRQLIEAVVPETIEELDHAAFLQFRIERIATHLAAGLTRHPFIHRFFVWSEYAPSRYGDQALFFRPLGEPGPTDVVLRGSRGEALGGLFVDPEPGREIVKAARESGRSKRNFTVLNQSYGGRPHQTVVHYQWTDAARDGPFGIIGYTVDLAAVRAHLFEKILTDVTQRAIPADPRSPRLEFAVLDDRGLVVSGSRPEPGRQSARAGVDMLFYPSALKYWLNNRPHIPRWQLVVSVASPAARGGVQDYLLFLAVMFLIAVALFCAVAVHRQSTRLSQMRADFVANVSHQLKTPISILSAASETLRMQRVRTPEKIEQYAQIVLNETARLAGVVDQILSFSRSEARRTAYEFQPVDLAEVVRKAVGRVTAGGDDTLSIGVDASRGADLVVKGDRTALEEVVVNLLDNAIKYSNGRKQIEVAVERRGSYGVVSVRDQGIGIARAELDRIFEKFYRGGQNGAQRGFGLGLSIVHNIVRAHDGRIVVQSEPGRGSEFRVMLPAS